MAADRRLRLLLTADTAGGVWDYAAALSRELDRHGHHLLLAVIGTPSADQLALLPAGLSIETRDARLEWQPGAASDLVETAAWLAGLSASWHATLVHLNQLTYPALARFRVPTLVVVHSDVCSWFREVARTEPPPQWDIYVELVTRGLGAATAVVAPTRYQAIYLSEHFGRSADRVIHNGVSVPLDTSRGVPSVSLPKERLVLFAGRAWDRAKGAAVLDRALALLGSGAPTGVALGELAGPAGERFRPTRLIAPGRVDAAEVSRWMRRAAICAAPSLYEPFGLTPVEAASHECALVLSDVGSFRELWDGCAVFFQKGSAESLAAAIDGLVSDPARRSRLAGMARDRAVGSFGAERMAADYVELYRLLVAGEAAARVATPSLPGVSHGGV